MSSIASKVARLVSGEPIGSLRTISRGYARDDAGRAFKVTDMERYIDQRNKRLDKRKFAFGHMRYMREITESLSNKTCGYILLLQPHIAFKSGLLVSQGNDPKPLKVNDIARIWNVTRRTAITVLAELELRSIVFECDGKYTMNERYHFRKKAGGEVDALIKTYFTPLREFTLSAADLGFVYKVLPYVHYDTNMVCAEPFAEPHDIRFLNQREIADLVGMDEKKVIATLKRLSGADILRGYIEVSNRKDILTILNPHVFYRKKGKPDDTVMALFSRGLQK